MVPIYTWGLFVLAVMACHGDTANRVIVDGDG
jgi:hypothetical protein